MANPIISAESKQSKERKYGVQVNMKFYLGIMAIFFVLIICVGIVTRILPQGHYQREIINGNEYIVNGTYKIDEVQSPMPVWRWFTAPFEVAVTTNGIIGIITISIMMVIAGFYYVFDKSGVLQRFLRWVVKIFGGRKYVMLTVLTLVFLLLGSVLGQVENVMPLIPFFIALAISLGWDSLIGVGIVFLGALRGFAAATLNPYSIAVAQTVAGVPLYSGMWLRVVIFILTAIVLIGFLYIKAKKAEKNPENSIVYACDKERREAFSWEALTNVEKRKYPFKEMVCDFFKSMVSFLPMIAIVQMIMSLTFILERANIMDTIIYGFSKNIGNSSPIVGGLLMLLMVFLLEFFIAGSMLKVFIMMPILIPLGDIIGISRQTICLIFILGDGFANAFYPTDTLLLMVLGMVGISYRKWMKWALPLFAIFMFIGVAVVIFAILTNY